MDFFAYDTRNDMVEGLVNYSSIREDFPSGAVIRATLRLAYWTKHHPII